MEKNLLIGNGINIQFGGLDVYSGAATMSRIIKNINAGKYTALTENSLSTDEQLELLEKMVMVIDHIKAGKCRNKVDNALMAMELDRITRTYPNNSSITSVFLEDYFLAFEIFNNGFKSKDGEIQSEFYRKTIFTLFQQMFVDGIYNDGLINDVYKNFYPGTETGAGQHGVAAAASAALLGLKCDIYMGEVDIARQNLNVIRMEMLGATVVAAKSGQRTLKEAVDEALEAWIANKDMFYVLGSAVGPHPYPWMVRYFQSIIGREARAQMLEQIARLPDMCIAAVGGGSNAQRGKAT